MNTEPVSALIQKQFDAYNAKDVESWLNTYSHDAKQFLLHGECLASGHDQIRKRIIERFKEPDLFAQLLSRTVMDNCVVDLELITRNFPEGKGTVEMLCIYQVENDLIQAASFMMGKKKLDKKR